MRDRVRVCSDIQALLNHAPEAVNSFYPGHWQLMQDLEENIHDILETKDIERLIPFLVDVAFLKQPYRIDREYLRSLLSRKPEELSSCIRALCNIGDLDYQAMDLIAKLPYFGTHGGRSFNFAVLRIACPKKFAIIDWRNLAVMANANGYEGFITPALVFNHLSPQEILTLKGHIFYSQELYIEYNEAIRSIAETEGVKASEVDLAIWTFSIQRLPFCGYLHSTSIFKIVFNGVPDRIFRKELKGSNRSVFIGGKMQAYLNTLKELGYLSEPRVRNELISIFEFIMTECTEFGKLRPHTNQTIRHVISALNIALKAPTGDQLLSKCSR